MLKTRVADSKASAFNSIHGNPKLLQNGFSLLHEHFKKILDVTVEQSKESKRNLNI